MLDKLSNSLKEQVLTYRDKVQAVKQSESVKLSSPVLKKEILSESKNQKLKQSQRKWKAKYY